MKSRIPILLLLSLLLMASCNEPENKVTTYTLKNKLTDAWHITATCYEYDSEDHRIDSNTVANPTVGQPYCFEANPLAHHVKVKLTSEEQTVRWGSVIFYLVEGEDTPITVGLSMMANYSLTEPLP